MQILFIFLAAVLLFINNIFCLTPDERGELARRFKYYHSSVRPGDKFNLVETLNGTFFNLNTEIEMLQTRASDGSVDLELVVVIHYLDDRLIMRELTNVLAIPNEFDPWIPNIETSPNLNFQKSVHVDPKTGQITVFFRVNSKIPCYSEIWKHPFDSYQCELFFSTEQDERIFLRALRDLRPDNQINSVTYRTEEWPYMMLFLSFNSQWHSSIVNIYLPTILILSLFIFAQWKRRKIQILIGVSSLISIIILQTSQRRHEQITLQDLWMSGILLHLIAILTVDLVLPARRIVHTTISSINEPSRSKSLTIQDSPVSRNINRYSSEQAPLLGHSPKEEKRKDSGKQIYGYIGPAATEAIVPLARNDTESDALTDVYVFRHSQNIRTPPIQRKITQTTIGYKKRIALGVILIFYAIFIVAYTTMVFFVLNLINSLKPLDDEAQEFYDLIVYPHNETIRITDLMPIKEQKSLVMPQFHQMQTVPFMPLQNCTQSSYSSRDEHGSTSSPECGTSSDYSDNSVTSNDSGFVSNALSPLKNQQFQPQFNSFMNMPQNPKMLQRFYPCYSMNFSLQPL